MEAFTDAISLWRHSFRLGVIYIVYRQIQLVIMVINTSTVFCASIGQNTQHRKLVFFEERQDSVIEHITAVIGVLVVYSLAKATLA